MTEATTPRSRRATWQATAVSLVEEFQAHGRGEGNDSFPPWRIGYMAGLQDVVELPECYTMSMHRVQPHQKRQTVVMQKAGRPSRALVDLLAWHYDQDVRRYELDHVDHLDMWFRLPCGRLLVDPLMRVAMEEAGMDETSLAYLIRDAEGFGTKAKVEIRMPGIGTAEITVRHNEIHARFELPGTTGAMWSNGHLTLDIDAMPETLAAASRGRPLNTLVSHPMIDRAQGIAIAAVTRNAQGRYIIATDSARGDGMVATPESRPAIAA